VVELIKQVDRPYPIRQTDLAVLDYAQENNVKAFIIVPAQVCRFTRSQAWRKHAIELFRLRLHMNG
jgi:hypothetical protein